MRKLAALLGASILVTSGAALAEAEQYEIDQGHTFVTFEANHIGYAWIPGTFDEVNGDFTYDPDNRSNSSAEFTIDIKSLDTDHTKRDKHLRSDEFFNASEYPKATFKSTSYEPTGEDTAVMTGDLTIKDVTREVELKVRELKAAVDPWDDFRRAFEATTTVNIDEFNVDPQGQLPPGTKDIELRIAVEVLRR
jgi:polyisoprenoid-binding protein YceI